MKKPILILHFIFIYLFSLAQNLDSAIHYKTKDFDVAIFTKKMKMLSDTQNIFTPSTTEVDSTEKAFLEKTVTYKWTDTNGKSRIESYIFDRKTLKKFRRQYIGYIDSNGHKILIINSFISTLDVRIARKWLEKPICITDMGGDLWFIKFDLNRKQFFDYQIGNPCDW